jgi:hypothetical protein
MEKLTLFKFRYLDAEKTKIELQITADLSEITAEVLEQAMLELAALRFEVQPPVPSETPRMPPPLWIDAPLATLHNQPGADHAFLSIREPGRGWLHYRYLRQHLLEFRAAIDNAIAGAPKVTLH